MLTSEHTKEESSERKTGEGMIGLELERTFEVTSVSGKIIKKKKT